MFDINSFSEYKIKRETLEAIAEKLRAMIGKTSKLTTEEIIYWLGRVKFIPQGHGNTSFESNFSFNSEATGIIPHIERGVANSTIDLKFNFESSATN